VADYAITFARSARRELEILDASIVRRVISRIDRLTQDPRPSGSRKLQGEQNLWRIRIGDYRVVYSVDDRQRIVDIVRHRREALSVDQSLTIRFATRVPFFVIRSQTHSQNTQPIKGLYQSLGICGATSQLHT
jgi:mRNA interferase RelE/StbE